MSKKLGHYQRVWHLEVREREPKTKWDHYWQATGAEWGHTRTALLKEAKELNAKRQSLIYRVRRYRAEKL